MSEYLNQHLEPAEAESTTLTETELAKLPEGVVEIPDPNENGETTVGNLRYVFRFSEIDPKEFMLDRDDDLFDPNNDSLSTEEAGKILRNRIFFGKYDPQAENRAKILSELKIFDTESGEAIDITSLLPEGWKIVCQPTEDDRVVAADFDSKVIYHSGRFFSLKTLVSLMHEIGHSVIDEGSEETDHKAMMLSRKNLLAGLLLGKKFNPEELEATLKNERDAWAFSLRKLKKLSVFKDKRIRELVREFVHKISLMDYSENIRKILDPEFNGMLPDDIKEYLLSEEEE